MRAADYLVDLGPGAGEHGGRIVAAGHRRRRSQKVERLADRAVPGRHARRSRCPSSAASRPATLEIRGARAAQPARRRRRDPARRADLRHRRLGLGQVDARQRDPLQGGRQPPACAPGSGPARTRAVLGPRPARQGHQDRPVADRPHAALEPRHLHRAVRPHPRPLHARRRRRGPAATSPGASASTSRAGAARSARATARSRSRCTSCRTSTSRASSATASATTARRSRSASRARRSPTCSTCRSRRRSSSSGTSRRSTGAWRRCTTSASATSASASRRRRSRAARRSA